MNLNIGYKVSYYYSLNICDSYLKQHYKECKILPHYNTPQDKSNIDL